MNTKRIRSSVDMIEEREKALAWLERHGVKLTGKDDGDAYVTIDLYAAGACEGAKEAKKLLASYARISLPELVQQSIRCCKNDIQMAVDAISQEIGAQP